MHIPIKTPTQILTTSLVLLILTTSTSAEPPSHPTLADDAYDNADTSSQPPPQPVLAGLQSGFGLAGLAASAGATSAAVGACCCGGGKTPEKRRKEMYREDLEERGEGQNYGEGEEEVVGGGAENGFERAEMRGMPETPPPSYAGLVREEREQGIELEAMTARSGEGKGEGGKVVGKVV